jgi:recombination protein RecA
VSKKDKKVSLKDLLLDLNKTHGDDAVVNMSDANFLDVEFTPSGSLGIDLNIGGYPKGRITEIFGLEGSGKTTLATHAIAECQKQGGKALIVDAECAFDRGYASDIGVDVDNLIIVQPETLEQAFEITEKIISTGEIDLFVIDSVPALIPRAELEGEMGDSQVGLHARLMKKAMRKLTKPISENKCCAIFINQITYKIGVMFGNPETTSGGTSVKYASSLRIQARVGPLIKDGEEVIGQKCKLDIKKNKVGSFASKIEFDLIRGLGINRTGELLDIGVDRGLIEKSGSWFKYGDVKLGQGRENSIKLLSDNPELIEEIEEKIKNE